MMHDPVSSKMHPEHIRQLIHQYLGHLQCSDHNPQIAGGHHSRYVTAHHLILKHFFQQLRTGIVDHSQQRFETLAANSGACARRVYFVENREKGTDEGGRQTTFFTETGNTGIATRRAWSA